jgi:hypothetical protein
MLSTCPRHCQSKTPTSSVRASGHRIHGYPPCSFFFLPLVFFPPLESSRSSSSCSSALPPSITCALRMSVSVSMAIHKMSFAVSTASARKLPSVLPPPPSVPLGHRPYPPTAIVQPPTSFPPTGLGVSPAVSGCWLLNFFLPLCLLSPEESSVRGNERAFIHRPRTTTSRPLPLHRRAAPTRGRAACMADDSNAR